MYAVVRLNGKGVGVRIDSHNHCYYERQLKPTPAAAKWQKKIYMTKRNILRDMSDAIEKFVRCERSRKSDEESKWCAFRMQPMQIVHTARLDQLRIMRNAKLANAFNHYDYGEK